MEIIIVIQNLNVFAVCQTVFQAFLHIFTQLITTPTSQGRFYF